MATFVEVSSMDHDTSYKCKTFYKHDQFLKKSGKLQKKVKFYGTFFMVKFHFSKMVHRNEFWFFVLQSVHQDVSYKL